SDSADRPGTGDADQRLQTAAQAEAPKPKGISAVAVLWTFGKCLGALLPVYLAGYYRVSTSLLVCGMMVYTGWKHARDAKEARLRSAIQLEDSEDGGASRQMSRIKRELPAWVNFPDVEKVEWLNKVLQQVWPFVGQYLEKLLVETIAPSIRASSTHLQTFGFTKVDMGDKAMKVVGIKAHTENDKGQVLLDLYISFVGNVEINVEVKRYFCKAGVKGMQLHGMMRVILEPLIGDVPIVGAVSMFFIKRPKLDINWTGLTNLLDIPGLNVMSDSMIMDAIASCLVLPNRLVVPLVQGLHVAQLRSPLPRGVVRIYLLEAQNLAAKDNYVKGVMAGLSDPYAIMRVGPQHFTSKHVDNTNSPKWNETYEVIVHEVPGQELEVEVYDKDPDQDDFLGRTTLDLGTVKKSIVVDEWFTLKDTESGRVHFRLEWLSLLPGTDHLEQILKRNESITSKAGDPPSSAILVVYVDKAEELPTKKGNKEPNPLVQLSVQDTKRESKVLLTISDNCIYKTFICFRFVTLPLIQRGGSADRVQGLGSLTIPLSRLLSTSDLSLDQWFQLDKSGSASRIYVKAVLRVLWLDEERVSSNVASDLEAGVSKQLPQQTSPHPSFATEGLLRIHLLAGQNLIPKDNFMGGMVKGKSDPYVKINIGGETFTSQVIKGNLNPTWNEMYEVILTQLPGQELHLEVFDYDMDMKDDFMGRVSVSVEDIINSQYTDQWYTLNDVKSGRVRLILEWVQTISHNATLEQVMQMQSLQSFHNKAVPAAALLFVLVEQANSLPLKKSGKEPKAGAELVCGNTTYRTKVCDRSRSPIWSEAFHFLVHDPREEMLIIKLSSAWDQPMGSLVVPVRQLLSKPQLVLDEWMPLDGASPDSEILLRAELKIIQSSRRHCDLHRRLYPWFSSDLSNLAHATVTGLPAETVGPAEIPQAALGLCPALPPSGDPEMVEVEVTLSYSPQERQLMVVVHACRGLLPQSKDGVDSYVSLLLLPDKNKATKKKTAVKKRDHNPEYNERFRYDLPPDELRFRRLSVTVKNNSASFRSRDVIGQVQIELAQVDLTAGVTDW
uniref:Extended synaptotagmin 1 n=1 Tax=Tetraodon nigroviridis TaxID=99883 RepID=H3C487_TETNG